MKTSWYLIWAAICAVSLLPSPATAKKESAAAHTIRQCYQKMENAINHRDFKNYLKYLSPQFKSIDTNGHVHSYQQEKSSMMMVVKSLKHIHALFVVQSIDVKGNHATVIALSKVAGLLTTHTSNGPKSVKFMVETKSRDLWHKTANGWLAYLSKDLTDHLVVNDKTVKM